MKMNASRAGKFPTFAVFICASVFVAAGVWAFLHSPGKNIYSTLPLFWLAVLVCAPLVSAACAARLFCEEERPRWLAPLATVLAVVQLFVWGFVVLGVLHYSTPGVRFVTYRASVAWRE
jgi:hypothetical protein